MSNQPTGADDRDSYRAMAWDQRLGDPRYADPIRDVMNAPERHQAVKQLASDLSGHYGPFSVRFTADPADPSVSIYGLIYDRDGHNVGSVERSFIRDPETQEIVVRHDYLALAPQARRNGFARALQAANGALLLQVGRKQNRVTSSSR